MKSITNWLEEHCVYISDLTIKWERLEEEYFWCIRVNIRVRVGGMVRFRPRVRVRFMVRGMLRGRVRIWLWPG